MDEPSSLDKLTKNQRPTQILSEIAEEDDISTISESLKVVGSTAKQAAAYANNGSFSNFGKPST